MSPTSPGLTFLSWYRRGLAAGMAAAPDGAKIDAKLPAQATIPVNVFVNNVSAGNFNAQLYSPGDVAGFDVNQIIRTDPAQGAINVETSFLPLIEFGRADLPWMLTPNIPQQGQTTDPDPRRGLRPWLVLAVIPADSAKITPPSGSDGSTSGSALPLLETTDDQLPDLKESWLWAHAQFVTTGADGENFEGIINSEPQRVLSRLISPRRLHPSTTYVACLVPAFKLSADNNNLEDAWQAGQGSIQAPVYFSWEFTTGQAGDFESLARLLKPFASSGGGLRRIDVGQAGSGMPGPAAGDPAWELNLEGVLVGPDVQIGEWDASVPETTLKNALATRLDGTPDELAPPVYGSAQAGFEGSLSSGQGATWLRALNLDPRYRAAAATGTAVVQRHQEALMASAWQQAAQLRQANRLLARGQLAREVNSRIYQKRIGADSTTAPLTDDRLMQLTATIHSQISAPTGTGARSIAAAVAQNSSLQASVSTSFRRSVRPEGPLAKRTYSAVLPRPVVPVAPPVLPIAAGGYKVTPKLEPVSGQVAMEAISTGESLGSITSSRVSIPVFPWEPPAHTSVPAGTGVAPVLAIPYGFMSDLLVTTANLSTVVSAEASWIGRALDFGGAAQLGWSQLAPQIVEHIANGLPNAGNGIASTYVDFADRNGMISFTLANVVGAGLKETLGLYHWSSGYPLDANMSEVASGYLGGGIIPISSGSVQNIAVAATDLNGTGNIDVVFVWIDPVNLICNLMVGLGLDKAGTMTGGWSKIQGVSTGYYGPLSVAAMGRQVCIFFASGGLNVLTLASDGTIANSAIAREFDAPYPGSKSLLPPEFVTGAITALAFGAGGMDLIFCYQAGAYITYRLVLDIQSDGTSAAWGDEIPLPISISADQINLLVGVMTASSAQLREQQTGVFRSAASATQARQQRIATLAAPPPAPQAVSLDALAQQVRTAIDPNVTVSSSTLGRLQLPSGAWTVPDGMWAPNTNFSLNSTVAPRAAAGQLWRVSTAGVSGSVEPDWAAHTATGFNTSDGTVVWTNLGDVLQRLVCTPYFSQPMYEAYRDLQSDRFVPGLSSMPDNRVTLLKSDTKMIEAYLVGLSAEMARALLWHGFDGNLAGTYFDRFWDSRNAAGSLLSDITDIAGWAATSDLGSHSPSPAAGATELLVLVVRGELLRRVPHVTIYAAPAQSSGSGRTIQLSGRIDPLFSGHLNPDIALFGFNLNATGSQVRGDDGTAGWYFVFQEHPVAPRFGLGEPPSGTTTFGSRPDRWRNLDWSQVVTSQAEYDALTYIACRTGPLAGLSLTDNGTGKQQVFGFSAAHMAHIMFQPAVQVAIHASLLLPAGAS